MRLTLTLALTASSIALTVASPTPAPCPAAPANYCNCGVGDHDYKYLCRANNGYTWQTNDESPTDPCPCKYKKCTIISTSQLLERAQGQCDETGYVHTIGTDGGDKGLCLEISFAGAQYGSRFWWSTGWKFSPPLHPEWKQGTCDRGQFKKVVSKENNFGNWTSDKNVCGPVTMTKYASTETEIVMLSQEEVETYFHGMSGNKCREASPYKMAGVDTAGECPASYDMREKVETDTICKTGGNLKYCPKADIVNTTITTWGESGWKHMISNNHCIEANFTLPGVNMTGRCDTGHYKVVQSDKVTTICRTGGNLKYCPARDWVTVEVVTRGD